MALLIRTLLIGGWITLFAATPPAWADYRTAQAHFDSLPPNRQTGITLALIATGDFEGLAEAGFTRLLYRAILQFEDREGFVPDGILSPEETDVLDQEAERFYSRLGNRTYTHPETGVRLLVPRALFDREKETADGYLFTRDDGVFSLSFVSFAEEDRSFDDLWQTLTAPAGDRTITYKRRFDSHFVATGVFKGHKFYNWMARRGGSTTGFTVSWGESWEDTGRKISVLLANTFLDESR